MPRTPKDPTSSPAPCAPEASRKAGSSRRRGLQHNTNWDKIKVFKEPEYRLPYKLAKYMPGRKGSQDPELWLQVAIESGLVVMEECEEAARRGAWLEPLGDNPPARMTREELEALIEAGIREVVRDDGK